jgi:shikimate dehydrogenase
VTARPSRLVLLGHPVAHSLSPAFQNAALRSAGIPLTYEAIDVAPSALDGTLRALVRQRAAGNVTVPHKEAVARLCDRLEPLAERTGAVNVFWTDAAGALVGDNTDVGGFDAAVRLLLGREPVELRVALVGAGGSAAAVLAATERWQGSRVAVWSRTSHRATTLAARFASVAQVAPVLEDVVRQADLVVNATPLGMVDDAMPFDVVLMRDGAALVDLVYRRGVTALVRAARARGLLACDGLPMLVEQGALAFERWFGMAPDREAMWSAVRG